MNATKSGLHIHGKEVLIQPLAKNVDDALAKIAGTPSDTGPSKGFATGAGA